MKNRRNFLSKIAAAGLTLPFFNLTSCSSTVPHSKKKSFPIVLSTWDAGIAANQKAFEVLAKGGTSLDAVEQGVRVTEADESNSSVGYGGLPDRDGHVTLDACIMDWKGNAGSVSFLENIKHPISVARRVMEKTPHVMLVGEGAQKFAIEEGFSEEKILTDSAEIKWNTWREKAEYEPIINVENHDTIGMLAIDAAGNLSGACTTSGLAFKMRGRVGDSPIIGAGLFVDNEIGGAVATGLGEAVLRTLSSFLVVELMRQGKSPQAACEEAIRRIIKKHDNYENFQVAIVAVNKAGEYGSYSIHPDFEFAVFEGDKNELKKSKSELRS